jgi:hypothetical protein
LPSSALGLEIVFFTAKQDCLSFMGIFRFLGRDSKGDIVGSIVDKVDS